MIAAALGQSEALDVEQEQTYFQLSRAYKRAPSTIPINTPSNLSFNNVSSVQVTC